MKLLRFLIPIYLSNKVDRHFRTETIFFINYLNFWKHYYTLLYRLPVLNSASFIIILLILQKNYDTMNSNDNYSTSEPENSVADQVQKRVCCVFSVKIMY